MSPQFVDFDGDGELDILTATFDGAVHLARGSGNCFQQPAHLLDRNGQSIVLNQYHSPTRKWTSTDRCDPVGGAPAEGHLTAAVAMDVDRDGDLDLILGDHAHGFLYLRRNTGSARRAAFASRNELSRYGDRPVEIPNGVMSLRIVDWNGDQHDDLLITSGDGVSIAPGGGIFVCLDVGQQREWQPSEPVPILPECDRRLQLAPARATHGIYADLGDVDGDGDFDLLVGGYATWRTTASKPSAKQRYELLKLEQESADLARRTASYARNSWSATRGMTEQVRQQRMLSMVQQDMPEQIELSARRQQLQQQVERLLPDEHKQPFVWIYENLSKTGARSLPR